MNFMSANTDPSAVCRVLIHPNNGVPKVWIAVASTARQSQSYRVWGSLKRGSLQARESSWSDMVAIVKPAKLAKGYEELAGNPRWFDVQQLVAAYLHGKPFLSFEGYQLGREAESLVPDRNLEVALRRTAPGVLATGGNPFMVLPAGVPAEARSSTRVLGKDDILKGVTASTGRSYAW
jgi:hypothetical protein